MSEELQMSEELLDDPNAKLAGQALASALLDGYSLDTCERWVFAVRLPSGKLDVFSVRAGGGVGAGCAEMVFRMNAALGSEGAALDVVPAVTVLIHAADRGSSVPGREQDYLVLLARIEDSNLIATVYGFEREGVDRMLRASGESLPC